MLLDVISFFGLLSDTHYSPIAAFVEGRLLFWMSSRLYGVAVFEVVHLLLLHFHDG